MNNKNRNSQLSRREMLGITAAVIAAPTIAAAQSTKKAGTTMSDTITVQNLMCEYLTDPHGIDDPSPRLSWVVNSKERGCTQTTYRILVASTVQNLTVNNGDLWDSGRTQGSACSQIAYTGKPLKARQECFWKVCVRVNGDSKEIWSAPALWEMGLLTEKDWKGSVWIGREEPAGGENLAAPYLRREFEIKGKIRRARVYACGLGYADISINGKRLGGNAERDTPYTAYNKRVLYTTYDVTSQLVSGHNALGAILGTGWYDVHDLATWNFEKAAWRGNRRLRLALFVDYVDGSTVAVLSDGNWKVSSGPILQDGIYSGEIYDARKEIKGWDKVGFAASNWMSVVTMPAPAPLLRSRKCQPIEITQTLKPVAITEPEPGVYIADFGQNFSGHVRLRVKAAAGTTITMKYAEKLHKDGKLDSTNIDFFMTKTTPPQIFQTDTYICKGGGEEVWEQRFSYSGFRYAEIKGYPGKPSIEKLEGRFAHTNMAQIGDFTCSDEMLNKIQKAMRWSYFSNAQSIPTDCPQREKNGWMADAHLAAETGLMNFDAAPFYSKWLDDHLDNMLKDGRLGDIIPSGGWGEGDCHPAWDSAYPIITWYLYQYCGDTRILARHYDHIRRYVDYLVSRTVESVIPFDSLGDWVPWDTQTPSTFTSTIYLYRDAQITANIARLIGKSSEALGYDLLADTTNRALHKKWFDPATNLYANGSQTAQSMPLYYDLTAENLRKPVFDALVANIEKQGHIDTGILGAKYMLHVLAEGGRADLALKLVTRKEQPSWAWWFEQGATTLWEDWKGESSLNHIMFGDVCRWFMQWLAGIGRDPSAPAFSKINIKPNVVGQLKFARAVHRSVNGKIASGWKIENGLFQLDITIPVNSTATVWVPAADKTLVKEGSRIAEKSEGVQYLTQDGNCIVYAVKSGDYRFTVKS